MTTLLISEIFPPRVGGSGRLLWEIYSRLPRREFVLAVGEHPRQAAFDASHDRRVVRTPLSFSDAGILSPRGVAQYWAAFRKLDRLLRVESFDRIHAARCVPEGWLAMLLGRRHARPYSCYAYGEEVNLATNGGTAGMMASRQLRWMTRAVLHGAARVMAISSYTQAILSGQWAVPMRRIRLIRPGVDTSHFVPASPDPATRARFGWTNRRVVLTVGRLQRRKGQDHMIRAFRAVRDQVPQALYAVVGSGEDEAYLRNLVRQEGLSEHVQLLGELDDEALLECYQQCDLFALPNRQDGRDLEGFGLVLLEAQACGKAVLTGRSGGTPDAVAVPSTGWVIDCTQVGVLARAVIDLLGDAARLQDMGRAARDWVVRGFDWAAVSRRAYDAFS